MMSGGDACYHSTEPVLGGRLFRRRRGLFQKHSARCRRISRFLASHG
jgi:hypothetical protein